MVEVMRQHYPTRAKLPPIIVWIITVFMSISFLLIHVTTNVNKGITAKMTPTMDTARYKLIEILILRQIYYNFPSTSFLSNEYFTSNTTSLLSIFISLLIFEVHWRNGWNEPVQAKDEREDEPEVEWIKRHIAIIILSKIFPLWFSLTTSLKACERMHEHNQQCQDGSHEDYFVEEDLRF